jgi:Rho-binding antiterminator
MRKQARTKPIAPIAVPEKITILEVRDGMAMNSDRIETDYKPVACANYDQYEIAIMHGSKMQLTWQVDNMNYGQVVTPLNLRTAHGEEYLILRLASGETAEVRLDHIRRVEIL